MFHRGVRMAGIRRLKFLLVPGVIVVAALFFASCEDEASDIGLEFKSVLNQVLPAYTDTISVISSVESVDSLQTSSAIIGILGDFIDPVFGRTRSSFMSQFRLSSPWDPGFNAEVDSMKVFFEVGGYYGNALVKETINIYELMTDIYPDSVYYSNYDLHNQFSEWPIGSATFLPTDSIIEVSISKTYARRILQDTSILSTQDDFIAAFKGLYVDVDPVNGDGAFVNLNLLSSNTYLVMYYHNDIHEDLQYMFYINAYTARVNLFDHEYDQAPAETAIRFLNQGKEDSVIYVQGISGVVTKLEMPGLKAFRDSGDIILNSAQLIFPLSPYDPLGKASLYPGNLDLNTRDEDGVFSTIEDLAFSEDYYGGVLDSDSAAYVFNITRHVQDYILGNNDQTTLYLNIRNPYYSPSRAVLCSRLNSTPLRLKLIYSKN